MFTPYKVSSSLCIKAYRNIYIVLVWIPDLLIAWGYMKLTDGDQSTFWWALLTLFVVQALFSIKNAIAGSFIYRLIGKTDIINAATLFLNQHNFPDPNGETDIECYYWDIAEDESNTVDMRLLARQEFGKVVMLDHIGFFPRLRILAAYNGTLANYHP